MKRIALCVLALAMLSAGACALQAPADPSAGGPVIVTFCANDSNARTLASGLVNSIFDASLGSEGSAALWGTGNRTAIVTLRPIEDLLGPAGIGTAGARFVDREGREAGNIAPGGTTVIELWSPKCGALPRVCYESSGYNIVPLSKDRYLFQDVDAQGKSTGAFFGGAGFYRGCAPMNNKATILVAGNSDGALRGAVDDLSRRMGTLGIIDQPRITYYKTEDWDTGLLVYFGEDNASVSNYYTSGWHGIYTHSRPTWVIDGDGLGSLAKVVLKGGTDPNGVKSALTVITSADIAFKRLKDNRTGSLAYQLFAELSGSGEQKIELAKMYNCHRSSEFVERSENVPQGLLPVVVDGDSMYIGKNGVFCSYPESGGTASVLMMDSCSTVGAGDLDVYPVGFYGLYREDAGATFISGLSGCATIDMTEQKKGIGKDYRSEMPSCDKLASDEDLDSITDLMCPTGKGAKENKKGLFGGGGYCACAEPLERDMKALPEPVFAPGAAVMPQGPQGLYLISAPEASRDLEAGTARITWTMSGVVPPGALQLVYRHAGSIGIDGYSHDEAADDGLSWTASLSGILKESDYEFLIMDERVYLSGGGGGLLADASGETMWQLKSGYAAPEVKGNRIASGPEVSRSGKEAAITWATSDAAPQLPIYWPSGYPSELKYPPKSQRTSADNKEWTVRLTGLDEGTTYMFTIVSTPDYEKLSTEAGEDVWAIAKEPGERSVHESSRELISEDSSNILRGRASVYMTRMSPGLTRSGIAYMLLPEMDYALPAVMQLKNEGEDFSAGSRMGVYRYEDGEIRSDCGISELEKESKTVGPNGGSIALGDMSLSFPPGALNGETQMSITKVMLDCPDLLPGETPTADAIAAALGASGEATPEAPQQDSTPLILIGVVAVVIGVIFLSSKRGGRQGSRSSH